MAKKPGKTNSPANAKKNNNVKRATKAVTSSGDVGADGRVSQRVPIQMLVDYRCNGNYLFDFCRDLGAGGVFIQTANPQPHGSTVHLTFTLPDSKETLQATGKVIWVQTKVSERDDCAPGMGVQFAEFGTKERKILEDFVRRYSPNSNLAGEKSA